MANKTSIKDLIIEFLKKYKIKNYKINNDLTIDVNGDVKLIYYEESQLPDYIQFNEVNGYFNISHSQIKTLKGCPRIIKGYFTCSDCQNLKSLEGAPKIVDEGFDCSFCQNLKTLKGATKQVKKLFICEFCRSLESLKGAPKNCEIEYSGCPKIK